MVSERSPRCTCGHPAALHQHHRAGTDCGECGRIRCPHYLSLAERDDRYLTWPQRHALAESDAHMYRNLAALAPFARSGERIAATRIPTPRQPPVRSVSGRYAYDLKIRKGRSHR